MKKIISIIIITLLVAFSACGIVYAESEAAPDAVVISVDNTFANPGDTVYISISISGNPGIEDYAFSFDFDSSVLKYEGYFKGVLSDYLIYNHAVNGKLVLTSLNANGIKSDGKIITYKFSVDKDAKSGEYKLGLSKSYLAGDNGRVKHELKGATLKIDKKCSGEHLYTGFVPAVSKTCTSNGIDTRYCEQCGHTDIKTTQSEGHTVEHKFTIDIISEDGKSGMLSRHCTTCGAKTSIVVFTPNNTSALGINQMVDNLSDSSISNLIYFINGGVTYPDITDDNYDLSSFVIDKSPSINDDGSINVGVAVDHILRKLFGNNKKGGLFGAIKRAAIADELPSKLVSFVVRRFL